MNSSHIDTIFAPASGAGRAAITVLRISGPRTGAILGALCRCPQPRRATLRTLRHAGAELDRTLVLWFPGLNSYTGEDAAELHLHGGRAVLSGVVDALVALGARPAEPGEFTRRAFLNGRLDLVQAEAIADLVEAETTAQRDQALRQLEGALGRIYGSWTTRLTRLLAQQEALIDFPDEDLPPEIDTALIEEITALHTEITAHLDDNHRGEKLREGFVIAITGPPNAGKSTLINSLAQRDVAIVSPTPGTTRDVLEARIALAGVPVTLLDTAGLRDSTDPIEAEGIARARSRAAAADLVVALRDATAPTPLTPNALNVITKTDLVPAPPDTIGISAATGAGMSLLLEILAENIRSLTLSAGPPPLTRARQRAALAEAAARLRSAHAATLPELRGEDLRLALRAIGRVTGTVGVEDILDQVFRQFCIGK